MVIPVDQFACDRNFDLSTLKIQTRNALLSSNVNLLIHDHSKKQKIKASAIIAKNDANPKELQIISHVINCKLITCQYYLYATLYGTLYGTLPL